MFELVCQQSSLLRVRHCRWSLGCLLLSCGNWPSSLTLTSFDTATVEFGCCGASLKLIECLSTTKIYSTTIIVSTVASDFNLQWSTSSCLVLFFSSFCQSLYSINIRVQFVTTRIAYCGVPVSKSCWTRQSWVKLKSSSLHVVVRCEVRNRCCSR